MKPEYEFKTTPYRHQLDEFMKTRALAYWARLWDMGTGKSKTLIDEAAWLYENELINAVLVFSNKGSYDVWWEMGGQIDRHLPDRIERYVTHWDAGASTRLTRTYEEIFKARGLRFLVMNTEALSTPNSRGFKLAWKFANGTRCLGVIDESSSVKNPKANRTKAALKLSRLFPYRRIMTGTPAANGPLNLYTQAEYLRPQLLGHSSWYSYRNEYCLLKDMKITNPLGRLVEFKKVVGYQNLDKLKTVMAGWSSTVRKEDCLDLPPKVYETYSVDLTAEQEKVYEELRLRSIAELENEHFVTAQLALTKVLRLQQVLCGYVPNEDGTAVALPEKRTAALLEVLEETSGKVVVWSRFVLPLKKIVQLLNQEFGDGSAVAYFGETKDRGAVIDRFQNGAARFLVGNQQTGGYGITLTAASTVVYFANSFDLEQRLQSEDRCHRIGQTRSVTYMDLVAKNTVDEKILKSLREKKKLQDILLTPNAWRELF